MEKTSRSVPSVGWEGKFLREVKKKRESGKVKRGQHELQKMRFQDLQKAGNGFRRKTIWGGEDLD